MIHRIKFFVLFSGVFFLSSCLEEISKKAQPGNEIVWIGNGMEAIGNQTGVLVDFQSYQPQHFETLVMSSEGLLPLVAEKETGRPVAVQLDSVVEGEKGGDILQLELFERSELSECYHHEILQNQSLVCRPDLDALPMGPMQVPRLLESGEVAFLDKSADWVIWKDEKEVYRSGEWSELWVADRSEIFVVSKESKPVLSWLQRSKRGSFEPVSLAPATDLNFVGPNGAFFAFSFEASKTWEGKEIKARHLYRLDRFGRFVSWTSIASLPSDIEIDAWSLARTEGQVSGALLYVREGDESFHIVLNSEGFHRLEKPKEPSEESEVEVKTIPKWIVKKERESEAKLFSAELCLVEDSKTEEAEENFRCELIPVPEGFYLTDVTLNPLGDLFVAWTSTDEAYSQIDRYGIEQSGEASERFFQYRLLNRLQPRSKVLRFRDPPKALQAIKTDKPETQKLPSEDKSNASSK